MTLYAIKHIPTNRFYTPNTAGAYRAGRNWRKNKGVLFTDVNDAVNEVNTLIENHRNGETLRIRTYGGYDVARAEDAVGDGYIRERDFRVVAV
ncbi:hypothetical protein [Xanthomonas phage BUDD]|nr:hypothetical protein [Xanthomonas phage BUDD]